MRRQLKNPSVSLGGILRASSTNRPERNFSFGSVCCKVHAVVQKVVNHSLENMSAELLEKEYPIQVFGVPYTYATMLIHLSGHLNYHLGQINYHRRLVSKSF